MVKQVTQTAATKKKKRLLDLLRGHVKAAYMTTFKAKEKIKLGFIN